MRAAGLVRRPPKRRLRTTWSDPAFPRYPNLVMNLPITEPDQVWVADLTYVRLLHGFVFLAIILDVYTRRIRGWALGRGLDARLTLAALRRALAEGCCAIHHSDQGVQYASTDYLQALPATVRVSMAEPGAAWQNGFAERMIRTIKEEVVDLSEYRDLAAARASIGPFLEDVYNRKRIHSSLGYLTPAEFAAQHQQPLTSGG